MNFLLDPGFSIYVAMLVALLVWGGIFALLWRLDRQARDLRRRLDAPQRAAAPTPRATLEVRSSTDPRTDAAEQQQTLTP